MPPLVSDKKSTSGHELFFAYSDAKPRFALLGGRGRAAPNANKFSALTTGATLSILNQIKAHLLRRLSARVNRADACAVGVLHTPEHFMLEPPNTPLPPKA